MDKIILRTVLIVVSISISQASSYVISESNQDSSQSGNSITSIVPSSVPPIKNSIGKNSTTSTDSNSSSNDDSSQQQELEQYWLKKRDLFFNQTTFSLTKRTNDYCGEEYGNRTYHLPFWFDYEMFKNLTDRYYTDSDIELKRHHIYIDNCVYIWKNTAFKRLHRPNNFTFIDHAEDWVSFNVSKNNHQILRR